MAHLDPTAIAAPLAGIAEPHQSTVMAILRAVGQGLFSAADADMLIDRVRAHTAVSGLASEPNGPDRTPA